jgi:hypothetical protein
MVTLAAGESEDINRIKYSTKFLVVKEKRGN